MKYMFRVKMIIAVCVLIIPLSQSSAKQAGVENLYEEINPQTVADLSGLACRNHDKIVYINVSINWTGESGGAEESYERLIFWTEDAEFHFPKGSYVYENGTWLVSGYFVVRSGETRSGVIPVVFEIVDDATGMLDSKIVDAKGGGADCHPLSAR
jgi:hypothetical protein